MLLKISHQTTYLYDAPVVFALQQQRLTPRSSATQNIRRWETTIDGGTKEVEYDDHHNNRVTLVSGEAGRQEISVHCDGDVETEDTAGVVGKHTGYLPLWYFRRPTGLTQAGANVRALVRGLEEGANAIDNMHQLSRQIVEQVPYQAGFTHAETTAEQALQASAGVCQDHAHIFLSAARLLGHPARYVSGYLMMQDRVDQDATHAWAEVHFDDIGWVGFDVSNRISPDARYVRVATGLDYREAAPIHGMRHGDSSEAMSVTVQVEQ
jgi:transglutaminase-like putative cysteine protease